MRSLARAQAHACSLRAGPRRCFAHNAPQFSEEQIEEISKHDAVLAQQIRKARDLGVKMSWQDLEDLPVQAAPQHWPREGGPPSVGQGKKEKPLSITEGAKEDVKKLWQSVKSWSGLGK
ncbi:unnamed protein product [Effrenium voratum]|nr:unnamed protein product [Effrenium voratum]